MRSLQKHGLVKPESRNQLLSADKRASAWIGGKVAATIGLSVMFPSRGVIPLNAYPAVFGPGAGDGTDIFDGSSVAFDVSNLKILKKDVAWQALQRQMYHGAFAKLIRSMVDGLNNFTCHFRA
jgi:hypothetical protein